MTGRTIETETCPNCGRTVTEVTLNDPQVGTCLFCDKNETGDS